MLQAKTKEGKLVTPASLSKAEIAYAKENQQFFCPTCKEQVTLKAGAKMIPHFAHRSKRNCPSHESGEGHYHENGKHILFQWLQQQQLDVALEVYLPEINQRPDLLVHIGKKIIALEFQCARVPVEQINSRNDGYIRAGITPIWILGANRFTRLKEHHLKLDQFILHFIHQFSPNFPQTLYFFCPNTNQFIVFQDIQLTRLNQAIGRFHIVSLNKLTFTDLFQHNLLGQYKLHHLWKIEKRLFRLKQRQHLRGRELAWHQWLYLKQTHLEFLPSIVHLPVSSQYLMRSAPWDWQSRLLIDVVNPLPIGGQFSIATCKHILRNQLISPNYFPLIKSNANPIQEYLKLLTQLCVIKQFAAQQFIKLKEITFHKNVEEALEADEKIINALLTNIPNKIQA
ncbi:competence protein CoiA [Virgibacillus ndiopensis]|uniref:competence protein CoiA n=1 Tax=Virgibacillus ndiopensis TaxID=2004408 RepID=UPI00159BF076|nr:competence protein CoiA family protein [Virgibacillus ndiopensis]